MSEGTQVTETTTEQTTTEQTQETTPPKTVSLEDHQRALNDLHKHKQRAAKLEQEQKTQKENQLKEQNQWKSLYEEKEKESNTYKSENEQLKSSYVNERKFGALREECAKLGIRAEAVSDLEMLDISDIVAESTSTGKINILNAKTFAERVKTLKPHWFDSAKKTLVPGAPSVTDPSGPVTPKDIYDAEKAARKSGKEEDWNKHRELFAKFRKQSAK